MVDAFAEDRGRLAACWPIGGSGEGRATFWDLRERSRALAARLHEEGVGVGDTVAIALPVGIDWAVAHLAALRIGAVAAPVEGRRLAEEITALSAVAVITERDVSVPRVRIAPSEGLGRNPAGATPGDEALASARPALCHRASAGGTGKSVVHSAAWIHAQRHAGAHWLDLRRTDLLWIADGSAESPAARIGMFAAWSLGVPVLFAPPVSGWEPVGRYPVSVLLAGIGSCRTLAAAPGFRAAHLRHCAALGAPLTGTDESWREVTGLALHTAFGVRECPILVAHLRGLPVRPGSVGRPIPGHDVCVLTPGGDETGPGETGELVLRGRPPTRSIEGPGAGPLRTAVRAVRDAQGYVRVEGDARTLA